jgi:TPR repeat protein
MNKTSIDADVDHIFWSSLAYSENPHDFLHFVRFAQNRDAQHNLALENAKRFWSHQDSPTFMPTFASRLRRLAEEGNTTAMFHLGRWHHWGYFDQKLIHNELYWFQQGMNFGDGRCTTQVALVTLQSDVPAGVALLHKAIDQGHLPAYCYLADHEPEFHDQHLREAAHSGDPFSMYCWGYHLMEQSPILEQQKHIEWIKRAAISGESAASLYLGLKFLYGKPGFDKDQSTAYEWLTLGAKYGNAKCMGAMGREMLFEGGDQEEAGKDWLLKASMLGDMYAQSTLGFNQLWCSKTPEEQSEGVAWLKASALQDNKVSIYRLAEAYQRGKGTELNLEVAAQWFTKGVEFKSAECQAALGYMYLLGKGVDEDENKAQELFQLASLQGDSWGTYMLGQCYANGYGLEQDFKAALECYTTAAAQQEPSATFKVGRANLIGEGTEKNKGAAVRWLRKASGLGNNDANVYLGLMLLYGDGVAENPSEAARWFRIAADRNDPRALRELGYLFADGKGVSKDIAEAQRLMATAASLNDDEAREWLDEHCPQKPDWLVKLRTGEDV